MNKTHKKSEVSGHAEPHVTPHGTAVSGISMKSFLGESGGEHSECAPPCETSILRNLFCKFILLHHGSEAGAKKRYSSICSSASNEFSALSEASKKVRVKNQRRRECRRRRRECRLHTPSRNATEKTMLQKSEKTKKSQETCLHPPPRGRETLT